MISKTYYIDNKKLFYIINIQCYIVIIKKTYPKGGWIMKKWNLMMAATVMMVSLISFGGMTVCAEEVPEIEKMATVLPNVRGDGGTHDLACKASEAIAESIDAELDIIELGTAVTDSAKWEAAMCDLCESDYDLIITGGSLMKDTIRIFHLSVTM